MTRILKIGMTLIHPYFRNKHDKSDQKDKI